MMEYLHQNIWVAYKKGGKNKGKKKKKNGIFTQK
jgi:hypothetical protein